MNDFKNRLEEIQEFIELLSDLNMINNSIVNVFKRLNNDLDQYSWFKDHELISEILSYIAMHSIDMAHAGGVPLASLRGLIDGRYAENVE